MIISTILSGGIVFFQEVSFPCPLLYLFLNIVTYLIYAWLMFYPRTWSCEPSKFFLFLSAWLSYIASFQKDFIHYRVLCILPAQYFRYFQHIRRVFSLVNDYTLLHVPTAERVDNSCLHHAVSAFTPLGTSTSAFLNSVHCPSSSSFWISGISVILVSFPPTMVISLSTLIRFTDLISQLIS